MQRSWYEFSGRSNCTMGTSLAALALCDDAPPVLWPTHHMRMGTRALLMAQSL
jgi:hypothetical protein